MRFERSDAQYLLTLDYTHAPMEHCLVDLLCSARGRDGMPGGR